MRPEDHVHRNDVIRLVDLALGAPVLERHEFSNCRLIGPAILLPLGTSSIVNCTWEGSVDALFWEIAPGRDVVIGAIAAVDCTFSACTFQGIGIAGPPDLRSQFARSGA